MEQKSLRTLAKELGVSHSYLSQVINGKRPASEKVAYQLLTRGLLKHDKLPYNSLTWRRSSVAEQGTHKPLASSSNLLAASLIDARQNRVFLTGCPMRENGPVD